MKVSIIPIFLSVAITDTLLPPSLLPTFIIKKNNTFHFFFFFLELDEISLELNENENLFPSECFPHHRHPELCLQTRTPGGDSFFFFPAPHGLQYLSSLIRV